LRARPPDEAARCAEGAACTASELARAALRLVSVKCRGVDIWTPGLDVFLSGAGEVHPVAGQLHHPHVNSMKQQGLQYYIHDGPDALRIQLMGVISEGDTRRIEQVWHTASSSIFGRSPIIDITFVTGLDAAGRAMLLQWRQAGAHFIADSKASRMLAGASLGPAVLKSEASPRKTMQPKTNRRIGQPFVPFLLAALLFSLPASAATLKQETVAAWDAYVESVQANLQERIKPGGCFLWTFERPERAAKVHAGEILVVPAPEHGSNPKAVPGGLIHHWMGAVFLPGLTIQQVLEVTRDYDRYKDFYRPSVIESAALARDDGNDQFSMRIMNRALFLKIALDADYQATYVPVDANRAYNISRTTRLQEIDEYGGSAEHKAPEGEGTGYIWKLLSIARLEQRDGGVYLELEAIALSRDIPAPARFFVDSIVRRISRNSLSISLEQTRAALRAGAQASDGRVAGLAVK